MRGAAAASQRPAGAGAARCSHARCRRGPAWATTYGGGALEERGAAPTSRRDLRHELDRAGAGADHGDALAGEVVVVVPARGVERRARRTSRRPGMSGHGGAVELRRTPATSTRAASSLAAGRADRASGPSPRRSRAPVDLGAEAEVRPQRRTCRAQCSQVGEDLRLRRERARPVGLGLEGERVQVRRDVAGARRDRCCRARCRRRRRPSRGSRSPRCRACRAGSPCPMPAEARCR